MTKGKATAVASGRTIAETDEYEIVEGNIYFPPSSVNQSYLSKTDHSTHCPWKGDAAYYSINLDKTELKNAAWYYPEPKEKAKNIKDYVAFSLFFQSLHDATQYTKMDRGSEDPHGNYDDSNRAFLQALMGRGQITLEEGKKILAAIFTAQSNQDVNPAQVTKDDIDSYIAAAADALSPLDFEIRSTLHQQTKQRIYAVVNSISDPLTQMATTRTSEEMFYIKRLLDAMFETHNTKKSEVMAVTGMQALEKRVTKGSGRRDSEENSQLAVDKGVTGEQAEKLLAALVKEKWLEHSQKGYYKLSPRALMELRSWLVDAYNEETDDGDDDWQRIKFCEACKEIVTVGQRCANSNCNVRLHNICETAFWNSKPSKQCPTCNTAWEGKHYVGEKVITSKEEGLRRKRSAGAGAGASAKRSRAADEDEDEDEDEGQQDSGNRRRSRPGGDEDEQPNGQRRSSRRKTPEEEEDEEEEDEEEQEQEEEEEEEEDDENDD
ncbi:Non-structural maintenance of chromosomes element-like protein [Lachnellula occidentalis]|uniref:Non-structural maintenance of chromosomes element 1 homolog n=1 Tax=Lachnellula occidentalis TaxID=215460 RepID=A0A8H8REU4_9HELO|nr:Non-structural maintenance of chromosomes element-like protein [Lachnellula occidentalis]